MEKLRAALEAQHQASLSQMKSLWCKEKETEMQLQVKAQVALANAAWREEQLSVGSFSTATFIEFNWCMNTFLFLHRWRRPGSRGWRR